MSDHTSHFTVSVNFSDPTYYIDPLPCMCYRISLKRMHPALNRMCSESYVSEMQRALVHTFHGP